MSWWDHAGAPAPVLSTREREERKDRQVQAERVEQARMAAALTRQVQELQAENATLRGDKASLQATIAEKHAVFKALDALIEQANLTGDEFSIAYDGTPHSSFRWGLARPGSVDHVWDSTLAGALGVVPDE
jgi:glutathione S-transferase